MLQVDVAKEESSAGLVQDNVLFLKMITLWFLPFRSVLSITG